MCDFLRVIAWFCDEKFSLKKSCFYLYIRRRYVSNWSETVVGGIFAVLEFLYQYSVPRYKLKNRSGKNNSQQGTDVIAYKYKNEDKTPDEKDSLVAAEVKTWSSFRFDMVRQF